MNELWNEGSAIISALLSVAGLFFVARIIIGFQKDLVASLSDRNKGLEERIDSLEEEVKQCDRRNALLVRAMLQAGIQVPPEAM